MGDFKYRVLKLCGEPATAEIVGYAKSYRKGELKIEHWVYGPKGGVYHIIVFIGGKVAEIKIERDF